MSLFQDFLTDRDVVVVTVVIFTSNSSVCAPRKISTSLIAGVLFTAEKLLHKGRETSSLSWEGLKLILDSVGCWVFVSRPEGG